ncbi:PLP-dependent aminotransferase family protein [Paenibacillus beijingensis]|uniref:Aminotransferase n=1 Tax=Paenibacillus beijingensis TaxID=1126833 RepID=A0A0D5NLG6_9BACL|nr:PLP-dependent aminotransferase family protein [Paenibacillus beijingensis]AJY75847.1 aminotransferase [Paenibacillus beijingensis]
MDYRFAGRVEQLQSSVVRDILKLTQGNEIISFAGGLPAEELFPTEAIRQAADRVFESGRSALQYGLTEGYLPLREQLSARMAAKGMQADPGEIILTTGSQQAIDLAARVLTEPGDVVLVENPTYLASLQIFSLAGLRPVPAQSDAEGIDLEDAERIIRQERPKLVYIVPTFGNPTGRVWSEQRRRGLLELCRKYGVLIIEDDPYGEIKFDEKAHFPTIASLEGKTQDSHVIYTSSFSKIAAPALRTGWAVADRRIISMMAKAKQASDLHSSSLDQQTLYQLLRGFDLDAHIRTISDAYGSRMREMQALLLKQAWSGVSWVEPQGGMFLWLELPDGLDAEALLRCSVKKGVAFVPGSPFYAAEPQRNRARLNFTHCGGERMAAGIERLSEALGEFMART